LNSNSFFEIAIFILLSSPNIQKSRGKLADEK